MRKEKDEELKRYIEELKTIKKELLEKQSRFMQIKTYNCTLNNGKTIPREQLLKNNKEGSAALIFPITKDNTTIITIQPRVFTKSTVGIGFPAGYVDDNEDYKEAAKRELLEETGYTTDDIEQICSFYQDDGCSGAFNIGFLARNCKKVAEQNLDKDEYIRYLECTIDEVYELLEQGCIQDVGTQLLLEKAKVYLKK